MTNSFARGSAPGRQQDAYQRPGSFKRGREKRGGRKRGTLNAFSRALKAAILEAAYRIGADGNGKGGLVGYFTWVALRHPRFFISVLLMNALALEFATSYLPQEPPATIEEINQWVRDYIELSAERGAKPQTTPSESRSPWDWTGQPDPVGSLMFTAIADPKGFCKLFAAAFLRLPTKRLRPRASNGF